MTKAVLREYGDACHLRLPGCTYVATTRDHLIPLAHGGEDTLDNCRPACRSCNSKRQDQAVNGLGATVIIVVGPPAAGKSSYVRDHAKPADVVIDLDRLVAAISPTPQHQAIEPAPHVKNLAVRARRALIQGSTRLYTRCTVWLIHAMPDAKTLAEYRGNRWAIIVVDPGRAEVEARAITERTPRAHDVIARWYDLHATALHAAAARHVTSWDRSTDLGELHTVAPSTPDRIEPTPPRAIATPSRPW
ncbi:MAG: HNH endonuclease [Mycetocola reblochoni]